MPMSLKDQIHLLSMVDIFGPLSAEEMEALATRSPDTYLDEGEILYTPQEASEKLFILKKGRVQVYEISSEGHEITLSVVEDGTIFGEMTLTGQRLQGVYVRALMPSYVCSIKRTDLEDMIRKNPEVGLVLVKVLAEKLHDSEVRMSGLVSKEIPARLATLILALVDSEGLVSGDSHRISTRYTHDQLASMIGAGRVSVSRAFSELTKAGAVELRKRYVHITNMDALREASEVEAG